MSLDSQDAAAPSPAETARTSDRAETPLPWGQLSAILAVKLAEPVNLSLIQPFMFEMVSSFDVVKSPKDVSFYAGVLFMSYSVCQATTSTYWGPLSDRIGRRPTVLICAAGDLITFVLFGLSKSFWWALATRCLNGFFVGNGAVIKSATAELADDTNRPRMMAMLPLIWHVGVMGGAAVGGLLANPAEQYPGVFGGVELFRTYPYLLPCLCGSLTTAFGLMAGVFWLRETLVRDPSDDAPAAEAGESTPATEPTTPDTESTTPATESTALVASMRRIGPKPAVVLMTPVAKRVILTTTLLCLVVIMMLQTYPIFAATPTSDGGLGFAPRSIGFSLAVAGIAVVYLQLVAYPRLERSLGALWCYRAGMLVMAPYFFAMPFLSYLAGHVERLAGDQARAAASPRLSQAGIEYALLWVLLVALLLVRTVGDILAFTSGGLLVVNIAPSKTTLGAMTGIQQLMNTLMGIIGPLASGTLWSWSIKHDLPYPLNAHLVWVLCGSLTLLTWKLSLKLPDSVNIFASGR
ncbi:hypothetical protein H4R18_001707 [Coemansia javaensis]|uniref:Major facilitator superfamily (MFS) profile domain-containing protein n=1 Tax=Coemansia javaensis TaxID=2761396 RepID=A0A9W8HGF5_9FUNG|nr:hypothetical protein H4R18_001707 [Coemansia javaensis]